MCVSHNRVKVENLSPLTHCIGVFIFPVLDCDYVSELGGLCYTWREYSTLVKYQVICLRKRRGDLRQRTTLLSQLERALSPEVHAVFAVNRSSVKMRHCSVVASVNSGFTAIAVASVLNAIKLLGRETSSLGVSAVVDGAEVEMLKNTIAEMNLEIAALRESLRSTRTESTSQVNASANHNASGHLHQTHAVGGSSSGADPTGIPHTPLTVDAGKKQHYYPDKKSNIVVYGINEFSKGTPRHNRLINESTKVQNPRRARARILGRVREYWKARAIETQGQLCTLLEAL